jgi:hypothetical protein
MEKPTLSVRKNRAETIKAPVRKTHTTGAVGKTVPPSISRSEDAEPSIRPETAVKPVKTTKITDNATLLAIDTG